MAPWPWEPTGQEQSTPSEYHQSQPTSSHKGHCHNPVPLTYSSTQEVCLPEPPLLAAQQVMWMWGRGMLGPFLVWVVRQQLQDREDPEAGTEGEPGRSQPTQSSTTTTSGQSCEGLHVTQSREHFHSEASLKRSQRFTLYMDSHCARMQQTRSQLPSH